MAALLTQERPNLFTQSVANLEPAAKVVVRLRYVQPLEYEAGGYELAFPMVAGPRYTPPAKAARLPGKRGEGPGPTPSGARIAGVAARPALVARHRGRGAHRRGRARHRHQLAFAPDRRSTAAA